MCIDAGSVLGMEENGHLFLIDTYQSFGVQCGKPSCSDVAAEEDSVNQQVNIRKAGTNQTALYE